jgi:hypothetical protein
VIIRREDHILTRVIAAAMVIEKAMVTMEVMGITTIREKERVEAFSVVKQDNLKQPFKKGLFGKNVYGACTDLI